VTRRSDLLVKGGRQRGQGLAARARLGSRALCRRAA
jgi:hypothetical protein